MNRTNSWGGSIIPEAGRRVGDIDNEITENGTNAVSGAAVYKLIVENEKIVATALTDLNERLRIAETGIESLLLN